MKKFILPRRCLSVSIFALSLARSSQAYAGARPNGATTSRDLHGRQDHRRKQGRRTRSSSRSSPRRNTRTRRSGSRMTTIQKLKEWQDLMKTDPRLRGPIKITIKKTQDRLSNPEGCPGIRRQVEGRSGGQSRSQKQPEEVVPPSTSLARRFLHFLYCVWRGFRRRALAGDGVSRFLND